MLSEQLLQRIIDSLKPAIAIVIAFGIALYLDLQKPYWAPMAIIVTNYSTEGQFIKRVLLSIPGTLLGGILAVIVFSMLPQQPILLGIVLVLMIGTSAFLYNIFPTNGFFFFSVVLVSLLAITSSVPDYSKVFTIALARTEETCIGVFVYGIVTILLWRKKSLPVLQSQVNSLMTLNGELLGEVQKEKSKLDEDKIFQTQIKIYKTVKSAQQFINYASMDTYQAWMNKKYWLTLVFYLDRISALQLSWGWLSSPIHKHYVNTALPRLQRELTELTESFTKIEEYARFVKLPKRLIRDQTFFEKLPPSRQAQVITTQRIFNLFAKNIHTIQEYYRFLFSDNPRSDRPELQIIRAPFFIGRKPFIVALQCMLNYSLVLIIWYYIYPTGSYSGTFLTLGAVFALLKMMPSSHTPLRDFLFTCLGALLALVVFVPIVPHLTSYTELGFVIGCYVFLVSFVFYKPAFGIAKMMSLVGWFAFPHYANVQQYDFQSMLSIALTLILAFGISSLVEYIIQSPNPKYHFIKRRTFFFNQLASILKFLQKNVMVADSNNLDKSIKREIIKLNMIPASLQENLEQLCRGRIKDEKGVVQEFIYLSHITATFLEIIQSILFLGQKNYPESFKKLAPLIAHWFELIQTFLITVTVSYSASALHDFENELRLRVKDIAEEVKKLKTQIDKEDINVSLTESEYLFLLPKAISRFSELIIKTIISSNKIDGKEWKNARF
ncbi:FUSC family protein [Halodesulfovibrio spirochaetisodalis]|uniref:Integral membrane protein YccS N-terminal domain-containing protein n=1 Tax=Halodesulfovibrio spirochaetisodalis TaxID=1560234 RepID=A0A1B7XAT4_9BACT|nr:FUSC family protein [Halodesulfovibrio spirochaetisodalis]OBQ46479.1 hypothetical protein SP90_12320 [Halodesulfovibrio spirochaetisodalis]